MRRLVREKEQAIALRRAGLSYGEIMAKLPVSKSSLSLWLKDAPLTQREKQALKSRKNANVERGRIKAASSLRSLRLQRERQAYGEARSAFAVHGADPRFIAGIALYWAEGSKRNSGFAFTNSDPEMVRFMVMWMDRYLGIDPTRIKARLFIHKPYAHERLESYWSSCIRIPQKNFLKTIYKPTGLLVKKRPGYKGCLRLELGQRATLLKMLFWQNMLIETYRVR